MSNKIIKYFPPASRTQVYRHDNLTYSGTRRHVEVKLRQGAEI